MDTNEFIDYFNSNCEILGMDSLEKRTDKLFTEFVFYSEKIESKHWENLFRHVFKRKIPFLDFFDLSRVFPIKICRLTIKRCNKTIRFYLKSDEKINDLVPLLFPFKFDENDSSLEKETSGGLPNNFFFITRTNILDFIIKEKVTTIQLAVFPVFGKLFCFAKINDDENKKKLAFIKDPENFLKIDMEHNPSFYLEVIHHPILKSMHINSSKPLFEKEGTTIGVDNYNVFKHTLITGMSGTGKSKFIAMKTKAILDKHPDATIVIIDPHAEFRETINSGKIIDFRENYIEPLETGGAESPMTIQLISQLISSIIDNKNKYAERVLFYSVHLLSNLKRLNLFNIGLILTDSAKRMEFVSMTTNDEIKRFFSTEFEDIYIHHFNEAILPVLNFIGQYELYMGDNKKRESLIDIIKNNRITTISFNPNYFGRNMIKFFAGAIIQQIYILALTRKLDSKTILIIDEFPIVQTKVAKDILTETRKFNLYLYLSMQYLSQIDSEILNSILTNMYNLIIFKTSKQDAKYLDGIMDIKVEEYFRKNWSLTEIEEEKKNLFTYLATRECIIRLYGTDEKFMIPMKVKTVDVSEWI